MTDAPHPSLLDPAARGVVDRLHKLAQSQFGSVIRHMLPQLPGILLGRPLRPVQDRRFFDDKLLPLNAAQGDLIYLLARAKNVRCAVEFGTSFGVSTIYLASAVRDCGGEGQVIGTEMVPAKAAKARANLAAAGLGAYVEIREGDARETLQSLDVPVDFLLIDGWPELGMQILRVVEPHLADGAIVAVDNVAQFRSDLQPVVDRLSHPPYRSTMLPFRSGTLVGVYGASGLNG